VFDRRQDAVASVSIGLDRHGDVSESDRQETLDASKLGDSDGISTAWVTGTTGIAEIADTGRIECPHSGRASRVSMAGLSYSIACPFPLNAG
jgi:hypothetical protein